MFEKEAKEYLKKDGTKAEQILKVLNEISPLKITLKQLPFVLAMLKQVYQNGAEFGYNKANEWHYVKDEDLPKNNTYCLVVKEYEGVTGKYTRCKLSTYKDNSFLIWNHEYDSYVQLHNVIAWKEIVLPELKESE